MDKKKKRNLIFVGVLLAFIIFGFMAFFKLHRWENIYGLNEYFPEKYVDQKQVKTPVSAANLSATQRKEFENFLNNFLKSLYTRAQSYKRLRGILPELVSPSSLRDPSYASENLRQMNEIIPRLNTSMAEVLQVFENNDASFRGWLGGISEPMRTNLLKRWIGMKKEQSELFIQYFALDRDAIKLYRQLLGLYAAQQNKLVIDENAGTITINDAQAQAQASELASRLSDIQSRQNDLFN